MQTRCKAILEPDVNLPNPWGDVKGERRLEEGYAERVGSGRRQASVSGVMGTYLSEMTNPTTAESFSTVVNNPVLKRSMSVFSW